MRLHENQELFNDAILEALRAKVEGGLGIKSIFIDKDYWICRSLSLMAESAKEMGHNNIYNIVCFIY
jgi:hypothetical protein